MRTKGRRESQNVEDRRRMPAGAAGVGGGLGVIGIIIVIVVALLGGDPKQAQNVVDNVNANLAQAQPGAAQPGPANFSPEEEELARFVRVVLADTEDVWNQLFAAQGAKYNEPKLVLFTDKVNSACGFASAATGPFYCPADRKVYLDLSFFDEMKQRFNAPGDFAQAYVVAHEVGHHVQKLMGISDQVQSKRRQLSEVQYNKLSVRLELQADYLAGVWAHHAEKNWKILEEGDIKEAINAASAIGDDRLQRQSQGYVVPESFTHGTSEQRMRWFYKGLQSGDMMGGNTFEVREL